MNNYIFTVIHWLSISFINNIHTNGFVKLSTTCFQTNRFDFGPALFCIDVNRKRACLLEKKHTIITLIIELFPCLFKNVDYSTRLYLQIFQSRIIENNWKKDRDYTESELRPVLCGNPKLQCNHNNRLSTDRILSPLSSI